MISTNPILRHLFVCALLNFMLCSLSFGTLRAAADDDKVRIECGSLASVTYMIIFLRLICIPSIVLLCVWFKGVTRFALMLDVYFATLFLCTELVTSSMQLTRFRCYESLKTDPTHGFAAFVYTMSLLITVDAMRVVYFVFSREEIKCKGPPTDDEIELLLQELDEDEEEAPIRKKPTKPAECAPGL